VPFLTASALTTSQRLLALAVRPGDAVVDATTGNGNDTVFLARLTGPGGEVHAFDIQPGALENARNRLAAEGFADRVRFYQAGHERMGERLPGDLRGRVRAVVFNLGFLPGGDEAVVTKPETTLAALVAARELLAPGGVISVVCYAGHPGGLDEARAVADWCAGLDFTLWRASRYEMVNKPGAPIVSFFIEKRG